MKYYETTFDEYTSVKSTYNIHKEIENIKFPEKNENMKNVIYYGPPGVGKYSEVLYMLRNYSPSKLKYETKVFVSSEKQDFTFHMSDIHFELDMNILGCNAKILFHEAFVQIVDILMMNNEKVGFLVCKNFHQINNELLEIFYSYVQQVSIDQNIKLYFILITEHISFLPNNILQSFTIINMKRPNKELYENIIPSYTKIEDVDSFQKKIHKIDNNNKKINIDTSCIINIKELKVLSNKKECDLQDDIFNKICDPIIDAMKNTEFHYMNFRELIYDILTYNLDVSECIWYIYNFFIKNEYFTKTQISNINKKLFTNISYYNNNYRPIYHLENIFIYILKEIHGL
jgi:hypothetical protein